MADLINRQEAIKVLEKIRDEHLARSCSRSSLQQGQALDYAIVILKKIPTVKDEADEP